MSQDSPDVRDDPCKRLEERLHGRIPLVRSMELTVESYDGQAVTLAAPLEANSNLHDTAFAGSLASLATLSGWCLISIVLAESGVDADVTVQDSEIHYRRPVTGDFRAVSGKPPAESLRGFERTLERKGKARIEVVARVYDGSEVAVEFRGRYVAVAAG